MKIEEQIAKKLIQAKQTVALAESCTGGLLGHRLTNISGSSSFLKSGLIVYSNEAKTKLLKVPKTHIAKFGAVSEEVARRMAKEVRTLFKSDYGIAVTGIAGPTGGTKEKPVGLVYIAIHAKIKQKCLRYRFNGDRLENKNQASTKALELLLNEFL